MNGVPDGDIAVFTEALRLAPEERDRYLSEACKGDAEFRRRVEALLQAFEQAGDFLGKPATDRPPKADHVPAPAEKPGDRIGHYKLLQQIGEGGCGVVYMAEQEAPVRRRVALKIIKPGMDTKNVIARFEAERQALALMDHPSIAKVFDAGATASGRPYFVMELVRGVKITEYCDENSLTTEDRLKLFGQVCQAAQHAHQRGIIHRDIKPSNILVTQSLEGVPTPMVIDFGVAKATTDQRLTDKTVFTAFEMLIGTPAYMSPEQAALSSVDVDTRTDIYSLGVLLYELLTGSTPFETAELLKAGLDEIRRVIREEEPVRPSTRLTTMTAADLVSVSKHHGAEPPRLIREMRGELDWIVMKALEKDRSRRYQTADSLAGDIQRYLRDETVSARPPSRVYQFRKLVARHKLEFATLGIIMATLVAGLGITTWSLSKEKRAHHEAEIARLDANEEREKAKLGESNAVTEAARSKQVTKLLQNTLSGVDPLVALGADTKLLREILDKAVKDMDLELTNQPAVLADMRMTIGKVYAELFEWDKAEPMIRKALDFYRQSPKGAEQEISDALARLASAHMWRPDTREQAEQEAREAIDWEAKVPAGSDLRLVELRSRLAWVLVKRDRAADAEKMFRDLLVTMQGLVGDHLEQLLDIRAGLATALNLEDKFDESEKLLRESLSIGQEKLGPEHPDVVNDLFRLGYLLEREHKFEEAEKYDRQCLALRRKVLGKNHPRNDEARIALGRVLFNEGKISEAADVYGEVLDARRQRLGDQDSSVAEAADTTARLLTVAGNDAQFEQLARQFPEAWASRADELASRRQWPEALAAASKLVELRPDDHTGYHLMAPLLVQLQDQRAYEELCQRITTRFAGANDPYTADRMAKDCLILPRPGADLKVPGELAETAITKGQKDTGVLPFFQCCKALAEYRLGHWEVATNWANRAAANSFPYVRAEANAILALAQFQLKHAEDARDALNRCSAVVGTEMPKFTDKDLGRDWRDLIIAHALQFEAKQLIDGSSANLPP